MKVSAPSVDLHHAHPAHTQRSPQRTGVSLALLISSSLMVTETPPREALQSSRFAYRMPPPPPSCLLQEGMAAAVVGLWVPGGEGVCHSSVLSEARWLGSFSGKQL